MKDINSICICGGGSLGLVCAGMFSSKGFNVSLLTGHPESWDTNIKVIDPNNNIIRGTLKRISSNPKETVIDADLVFLTVPGFLIEQTLEDIGPFLKSDAIVGSVVSSTGFFFAAHKILGNKYCLFGFQRVPYIARQKKYGTIGELLGYKNSLNVAIENSSNPGALKNELEVLFGTPIKILNNFYEASLTNSNPILHTGRLYTLWKDYNGEIIPNPPLFYADWNDEASECLIQMDNEFQRLLDKLGIRRGIIPSLLDYYESIDAPALTNKIRSIPAFQSIKSPCKKVDTGWIPDFSSRYFTEDFPFGLRFIKELAQKENINTPVIDKVYNWGLEKIKTKA